MNAKVTVPSHLDILEIIAHLNQCIDMRFSILYLQIWVRNITIVFVIYTPYYIQHEHMEQRSHHLYQNLCR